MRSHNVNSVRFLIPQVQCVPTYDMTVPFHERLNPGTIERSSKFSTGDWGDRWFRHFWTNVSAIVCIVYSFVVWQCKPDQNFRPYRIHIFVWCLLRLQNVPGQYFRLLASMSCEQAVSVLEKKMVSNVGSNKGMSSSPCFWKLHLNMRCDMENSNALMQLGCRSRWAATKCSGFGRCRCHHLS